MEIHEDNFFISFDTSSELKDKGQIMEEKRS